MTLPFLIKIKRDDGGIGLAGPHIPFGLDYFNKKKVIIQWKI